MNRLTYVRQAQVVYAVSSTHAKVCCLNMNTVLTLDLWDEMNSGQSPFKSSSDSYEGSERRKKPRIHKPFFANVRGTDANGESFKANTFLDNISGDGLYMHLARRVNEGTKLLMVVNLSTFLTADWRGPRVAIRGVVVRAEPQRNDLCGLAVRFTRYRFL